MGCGGEEGKNDKSSAVGYYRKRPDSPTRSQRMMSVSFEPDTNSVPEGWYCKHEIAPLCPFSVRLQVLVARCQIFMEPSL